MYFRRRNRSCRGTLDVRSERIKRMHVQCGRFQSPLGPIHLLACPDGLVAAFFDTQVADMERRFPPETRQPSNGNPWLPAAKEFLSRYFEGNSALPKVAQAPNGTPFQERVWRLLEAIPLGETRAYGALADALGRPGASRAVGAAVGAQPPFDIRALPPRRRGGRQADGVRGRHRAQALLAAARTGGGSPAERRSLSRRVVTGFR